MVVLGKGLEEVLEDGTLVTGDLGELLDDGGLVGIAQGRGTEDGAELLVGLEGLAEGSDSTSGLVEGSGLGGSSVLEQRGIRGLNQILNSALMSIRRLKG
jgi:hypothetical protein